MNRQRVFIGIGSNLGDRLANCRRAIEAIGSVRGMTTVGVSSLYESAPVPPASGDWFVNAVVAVETDLAPEAVLRELRAIERRMGRPASRRAGEPRTVDLDLLLYGSLVVDRPGLVVPHPRMHLRRFVLMPLGDLAPDHRHPVLGQTTRELLERLADPSPVTLVGRSDRLVPAG